MQVSVLTRRSLFYLFLSVTCALLLHSDFLPLWVLLLSPLIIAWRYAIYKGKIKPPTNIIKGLLVCAGFSGVYFSYGFSLSIESAVTLLVAGLALKPLEVQSKRDSYVLIFLCYFVLSQHFLFEQGPLAFLLVIVCLIITLLAQVVVNQSEQSNTHFKVVSKLFLVSLPLTVFLFFILPRLGPLWSLNISTKSGVIGLSASMSPGDVSELGRSDELAFRVKFNGDVPPVTERYWRALVLDYYDGESWESRYSADKYWYQYVPNQNSYKYEYEVISEPHEKRWLFSLKDSRPMQKNIAVLEDGLLRNRYKLLNTFQYKAGVVNQVKGKSVNKRQIKLKALQRQAYLQLPNQVNPKARAFSKELSSQASDQKDFLLRLSDFYRENPFRYTLSPGVLTSEDRVDEFLFSSLSGFCAHYAGSAVFVLRSAGIPARVIAGYLGGEKNDIGDYYSVYQYDAHAWIEVWIEGEGWRVFDPTGWVSPERVEQGIENAVKSEFVGFRTQSKWLREMRQQFQAFNYLWNDWMLAFKDEKQQAILKSIFGERSTWSYPLIISGLFVLILTSAFLFVFIEVWRAPLTKQKQFQLLYLKNLNKLGLSVDESMSFKVIEEMVLKRFPESEVQVIRLTQQLNVVLYSSKSGVFDAKQKRQCAKLLRCLIKACR